MRPGRELDALVAEKVMGWHREPTPKDARGENGGDPVLLPPGHTIGTYGGLPNLGRVHLAYFAPASSTEQDAAWRVWRNCRARFGYATLELHETPDGRIHAYFQDAQGDGPVGDGDTIAHAICLAALRAVGVDLPEEP